MLHNEARELLVEGYEKTGDAKAIAAAYSVSESTVYRLAQQKRETGSVALRTSERGRKPALTETDRENIRKNMDEKPDSTINEIIGRLKLGVSYSTVERAINAMGYTLKKKTLHADERGRPDVEEKRKLWKENITPELADHLVFLDESGINTDMTRHYGRAPSSQRAVDHAPLSTPKTTTVLSSIRFNGEKAFTTYQGGTTGERFLAYLKEILLPTLHQGDIVVMDNMRTHRMKAVGELLASYGVTTVYLPPYSPDLNPIEKMWSKMKSILRAWKVRAADALPDAVSRALEQVSLLDCRHWINASFYSQ